MTPLEEMFGLRGRRALVTGASSGLGIEFAEALAMAGADVVIVARRRGHLEAVASDLRAHGTEIAWIDADLSRTDELPDVVRRAEDALGPLDILVNNAGAGGAARAETVTVEQWSRILDVNLTAAFFLSQAFALRAFESDREGRIVNVSSVLGSRASSMPGLAAYAATKAALSNLTRQLAVEWSKRGVLVNAICPGYFPTELNEKSLERSSIRDRIEAFTPLARLGGTGELRTALLFLVAPASTFVTGETVHVDGGYGAW